MRSPGINGEGELRGQLANSGSPGKMAVKMQHVCVCIFPGNILILLSDDTVLLTSLDSVYGAYIS